MKRLAALLACVILAVMGTAASAQQPDQKSYRFQVKGGMVVSTMSSDSFENAQAGFGWTLGAAATIPFKNPAFGLAPEVNYVDKRAFAQVKDYEPGEPPLLSIDFTFRNLEVPVLVYWALSQAQDFRVYLAGGPVASFLLDAKADFITSSDERTEDVDGLKTTNWGFMFELGVRSNYILFELGTNFGLSSIAEDEQSVDPRIDTWYFRFGVAF